ETSMMARSARPIRREISWVRPPILPLTDSRLERELVERGSMAYSAVTQPRPEPLRQRGTPSVKEALHSTRVPPNSTRTLPSAWSAQPRCSFTGRSWSAMRPSARRASECGASVMETQPTSISKDNMVIPMPPSFQGSMSQGGTRSTPAFTAPFTADLRVRQDEIAIYCPDILAYLGGSHVAQLEEKTLPLSVFVDLDRNGPVPLYYQIAQRLEVAIRNETLPAGSRLENEVALAQRLGLSRPTIRRAIQELVDKGL